jgi:hypothetical protein
MWNRAASCSLPNKAQEPLSAQRRSRLSAQNVGPHIDETTASDCVGTSWGVRDFT